jgi:uncharacterized protein (TIRG00374 family)
MFVTSSRRLAKVLFSALIVSFLFLIVDFSELVAALSSLTIPIVLLLLLISIVLIYLSCIKWQYFVEAFGQRISIFRLFAYYLIGYFVNLFVPSYLGGDLARSFYVGKKIGQHKAFAATILERYMGLVAMLVLALFFMWFVDLVAIEIKLVVLFFAIILMFVTFLALSPSALNGIRRLPFGDKVFNHLQKVQESFRLARSKPTLLVKTLLLSFLFHILTVINTLAAAYAVGWNEVPVIDLFIVLPLILLIGSLPLAPSGLGLQEGAFVFFLVGIGASPAEAFGVAIVLRAKHLLLSLTGGALLLIPSLRPEKLKGGRPQEL